jgi:hypothetical protein
MSDLRRRWQPHRTPSGLSHDDMYRAHLQTFDFTRSGYLFIDTWGMTGLVGLSICEWAPCSSILRIVLSACLPAWAETQTWISVCWVQRGPLNTPALWLIWKRFSQIKLDRGAKRRPYWNMLNLDNAQCLQNKLREKWWSVSVQGHRQHYPGIYLGVSQK